MRVLIDMDVDSKPTWMYLWRPSSVVAQPSIPHRSVGGFWHQAMIAKIRDPNVCGEKMSTAEENTFLY